jgi:integrase
MAIGRICTRCKSTFKLSTETCPRCGLPTKFKVRLRTPSGYRTGQFDTLQAAEAFCGSLQEVPKTPSVKRWTPDRSPARAALRASGGPLTREIWKYYLNYVSDKNRSWLDDLSRWTIHVEPTIGDRVMSQVTPGDIIGCLPRHLSPASRHRVLALLKAFFAWSIKMDFIPGPSPCSKVDNPKYDNSRHRYLSETEKDALLTALEVDSNDFAKRVIKFLWLTGRRRGEVLSLEWSDVDMERGLVTFRHTKNGKVQVVPVNEGALGVLQECPRLSTLVFCCSSGGFFHSFNRSWVRIRKRAKLVNFHLHDLRATFASTLASSGKVDIYTLQKLLGHSQISMTQRYAHLMPGALKDAVEVMRL